MTNQRSGSQVYRNILVATDFSPHADAALRQAVWLAKQTGARIVVAHTLDITLLIRLTHVLVHAKMNS